MAWIFKTSVPIYLQVADELKARIFEGKYLSGEKMPTVREIAEEASVNPNTVQRAFSILESEGLVQALRTTGRIVSADENTLSSFKQQKLRAAVEEFLGQMRKNGVRGDEIAAMIGEIERENATKGEEQS